ncbi:hypothetical protein [Demequina sp. NBRC 110053]|uniref:hypothetical protein n=1 Tax=Demequina sp. NBRC 110053 TaxID=1570342 RepID=UPI000A036301|nr:hypothetical protein [Demequina sp. NBRC 110053]
MLFVTPRQVGRIEYGRMVRDGIIRTLIPGHALPAGIPDSPPLRRTMLGALVPAGAQVTGLAAAWAHGCGDLPTVVHVRTDPRRRVRSMSFPLPLEQHGVGIAATGDGFPGAIAPLEVALVDAMRWSPEAATACVRSSLRSGAVLRERIDARVAEVTRARASPELEGAWAEATRALDAA